MNKTFLGGALTVLLCVSSTSALARAGGTIQFNGKVVADTCKVNNAEQDGLAQMTVDMGDWTVSGLKKLVAMGQSASDVKTQATAQAAATAATAASAVKVPVKFEISNCNVEQVRVNFSESAMIDDSSGHLNTNKKGLQIRLLNDMHQKVHLKTNENNTVFRKLNMNALILSYFAEYYVENGDVDSISPGDVSATAAFALDYQ